LKSQTLTEPPLTSFKWLSNLDRLRAVQSQYRIGLSQHINGANSWRVSRRSSSADFSTRQGTLVFRKRREGRLGPVKRRDGRLGQSMF